MNCQGFQQAAHETSFSIFVPFFQGEKQSKSRVHKKQIVTFRTANMDGAEFCLYARIQWMKKLCVIKKYTDEIFSFLLKCTSWNDFKKLKRKQGKVVSMCVARTSSSEKQSLFLVRDSAWNFLFGIFQKE